MSSVQTKRQRLPADVSKARIIEAAEKILVDRGVSGLEMRAVARAAGVTDGCIFHHFRDRHGLQSALLSHGATKVRGAIEELASTVESREFKARELIDQLWSLYASGFAALSKQLHEAGWRERGSPVLEPVIQAVLKNLPAEHEYSVRLAFASLNQWLATEPLFGEEFRRSVGLTTAQDFERQKDWWVRVIEEQIRA